ncbi:MAG TPA: hypothetical protein VIH99_10745 [Bdellovibrionota bacterium]|jgi:hypothetical protein
MQHSPIAILITCLALAPAFTAWAGDQTSTKLTAYSADDKCDPETGGGNESAGGPKPLDHTWEKPGGGWVMAAVCGTKGNTALFNKMKGCTGKVKGKTIKVMDTCPACCKEGGLKHIDISHTCKGDTMDEKIEWDPGCKGIDQAGHAAIGTKN